MDYTFILINNRFPLLKLSNHKERGKKIFLGTMLLPAHSAKLYRFLGTIG